MEELLEEAAEQFESAEINGQEDTTPIEESDQELSESLAKQPKAPRFRPFPKAPRARGRGGTVSPDIFFEYWKKLPPVCMERCSVYVYREYPKMNYLLALSPEDQELVLKKKKQRPSSNIALFVEPFESNDWREEMLRRFGEGDYKLWLNDSGIKADPKARNQNVLKTFISIRDDEAPPVIPDLRCVDPSDPINQSYLEKLRLAGLYGQPTREPEEQEDMAANAEIVKDLTGRIIEMSKETKKDPPPPHQPPSTPTEQASIEAIRVMGSAFSKIEEQRAKLADPDAAVERIVKIAQTLTPPASNSSTSDAVVNMLTKQLELAEQRRIEDRKLDEQRHTRELQNLKEQHTIQLSSIEERIKLIQVGQTVNPTPGPAVNATSEFAVLDRLLSIKEKLDGLTGGGENSPIPGWVPYALQGFKIAGDVIANVVHNAAVARLGQGTPLPPPQTSAEPAETAETQQDGEFAQYARQIHPALKDALQKGVSGYEFAARLILQLGNTQAYDYVISEGVPGLERFLQSAPEVWGTMQQFGQGGQNQRFMEEFCNRAQVMNAIEILKAPKPQPVKRTIITDSGPVKATGGGPVINTTIKE